MQRKRRNISFRDIGYAEKSNEDIANPTNAAWWTSPKRIPLLRFGAVLRTRSSQVVMAAYGGITRYPAKIFNIIPYLSLILFLLLGGMMVGGGSIVGSSNVYAADEDPNTESSTTQPVTKGDATASITLDTSNIQVNAAPGTTAYATKNITINANNVESYTLTITAPTQLSNKKAGTYNDWSYTYGKQEDLDTTEKLEAVEDYKAFTGSAQELESGTSVGTGTNINITNSNKTIVFSSYFNDNAVSGHYTADVLLSLTSTPSSVAKDLSGITYMQEMTPEICENTPFMSEDVKYSKEYILTDKRTYPKDANGNNVSNTYTVRKIGTQCWMTQNLRIYNTTIKAADSDFAGEDIELPNSGVSTSDFGGSTQNSYRSHYNTSVNTSAGVNTTTYYNWYTATAGAGNSNVSTNNQSVNTSICPKGWTLPTGGTTSTAATESTWTDYYKLFRNMDLGISTNSLSTTSYTNWGSKNGISDLTMVQTEKDASNKVIYNFMDTGGVSNGSLANGTSYGIWWSSTAYSADVAYGLNVNHSNVAPGAGINNRYFGFAVRCVARGKDLTNISTMQEMTPEVCKRTAVGASNTLRDTRDGETYRVVKYADNRCWMAENLRIYDAILTSEDSDIKTGEFDLTSTTDKDLFKDDDIGKYTTLVYRGTDADPMPDAGLTTYYNWFAATAGAGTKEFDTNNASVDTSVCPKGWTLPTGGSDSSTSEFGKFAIAESIANSSTGSTKIRDIPYDFLYTGCVYDGSLKNGTSGGYWWSSTALNVNGAYRPYVSSSNVYPGVNSNYRHYGFAVRCIARN